MQNTVQVKHDIYWVGGNDRRVNRFENLFPLTHGRCLIIPMSF